MSTIDERPVKRWRVRFSGEHPDFAVELSAAGPERAAELFAPMKYMRGLGVVGRIVVVEPVDRSLGTSLFRLQTVGIPNFRAKPFAVESDPVTSVQTEDS